MDLSLVEVAGTGPLAFAADQCFGSVWTVVALGLPQPVCPPAPPIRERDRLDMAVEAPIFFFGPTLLC